jgi:hypothetical protein
MPHFGQYLKHDGWNDLLASLSAGKAVGVNAPTWSVFRDGISAYAFAPGTMNELWCSLHIGHDYVPGSMVYPHIHCAVTTANTGVVRWGIEYTFARGYGVDSFPASTTVFIEQTIGGTPYSHMISEAVEGSGIVLSNCEPDMLFLMRVFRDAGHVNDTFPDDAYGLFADLHYQSDGFLSNERNRPFTRRFA